MIGVDLKRSLLILNDRRFPAVALICPQHECEEREDFDRLLGGPSCRPDLNRAWDVYVPLESGVLIQVSDDTRTDACLRARTCYEYPDPNDTVDQYWLPHNMEARNGTIAVNVRVNGGTWLDCDHDWLAEHIDRLSRMRVELPSGPRCRPVSLGAAWQMMADYVHAMATVGLADTIVVS